MSGGPARTELDRRLATAAGSGEIAPELTDRLRAGRDVVVGPLLAGDRSGWLPVHGDAHPGNVLVLSGRTVWNDLEDC